jgi:hypothetical protein
LIRLCLFIKNLKFRKFLNRLKEASSSSKLSRSITFSSQTPFIIYSQEIRLYQQFFTLHSSFIDHFSHKNTPKSPQSIQNPEQIPFYLRHPLKNTHLLSPPATRTCTILGTIYNRTFQLANSLGTFTGLEIFLL